MTDQPLFLGVPDSLPKGRRERIERWTRLSAGELWLAWRAQFESDDDAIMTAVWIGNRLVKAKALSTRRLFYSIKDAAIVRYGEGGSRAREEKWICYHCVEGIDAYGDPCERCGGSGVFKAKWLYLHEFKVAGQVYRLHSYVEPKVLSDEPSADLESYGGSFSDAEQKALALPLSGLLRLLTYVAAAIWKLQVYNGTYS